MQKSKSFVSFLLLLVLVGTYNGAFDGIFPPFNPEPPSPYVPPDPEPYVPPEPDPQPKPEFGELVVAKGDSHIEELRVEHGNDKILYILSQST